jgi:excisionase family DNA binding protein
MAAEGNGMDRAISAGQTAENVDRYVRPDHLSAQASDGSTLLPMFLTAQQVAEMLPVDERTVLRWAQRDPSMPATRVGRVVRFEREPLLRWLARKRPRSRSDSATSVRSRVGA